MHCAKAAHRTCACGLKTGNVLAACIVLKLHKGHVQVDSRQGARLAQNDQEAGHNKCMFVPLLSGLPGIAVAWTVPSKSLLSVRLD